MSTFRSDLIFALRVLRKRPLTTGTAVLCLALGIGAATTVFSLVHGVLLRPLDYRDPEQVVMLWNDFRQEGLSKSQVSGHELVDFQDRNQVFSEVAGVIPWFFNLTSEEEPLRLTGGRATGNWFSLLGVEAASGRTFTPEETDAEVPVAVLGHDLWQRIFGGDPEILGRSISLATVPYTVIGVLPADVHLPFNLAEVWVPWRPKLRLARDRRGVMAIASMKPGVHLEQAQSDMDSLAAQFRREYPGTYAGENNWGIRVGPVHDEIVGDSRSRLLLLFSAVLLVLLIACANVANMLLGQAASREKEVALRASLGADRGRLIRQHLTESLVLAAMGCVPGLLLAYWGIRAVAALDLGRLGDIPRLEEVAIDWQVFAFAIVASLLTTLLFGGLPALKAARGSLTALKEGGRSSAMSGRRPLRSALVVFEIALAMMVLIGAGSMLRAFKRLEQVDPGFRTDNVLIAQLFLPRAKYAPPFQKLEFYRRLTELLEGLEGVRSAGIVSHLPLYGIDFRGTLQAEGQEPIADAPNPTVGLRSVSPDYFRTLGIPLRQGRAFSDADDADAPAVVIADAVLAERLWPGENPIGERLQVDGSPPWGGAWRTVVGVVGQVQHLSLSAEAQEQLYVPYAQIPSPIVGLALHTQGEPLHAVPALRQVVKEVDPYLPLASLQSIEQLVGNWLRQPRFHIVLFGLFGGVALILATVGVYSVMASSVAQRSAEIGVRMAFGARQADVLKLVVGQTMALTALGLLLGVGLTMLLGLISSRLLAETFYGGSVIDATTFVLVMLLLATVALIASLIPARRATRVDPVVALRQE